MGVLLLLLAALATAVTAYDMPGAYERVFLWYAREADVINKSPIIRIAPGCPGTCTFNQFVWYISDPRPATPTHIIDDSIRQPGVADTANLLDQQGLTGKYKFGVIIDGTTSTAELIDKAVGFAAKGLKKLPQANRAGLRNAINGIRYYRIEASSEAQVKDLVKDFPNIIPSYRTVYLQLDNGSRDQKPIIDRVTTITDNVNNANKYDALAMGARIDKTVDANHKANINTAGAGLALLKGCKPAKPE